MSEIMRGLQVWKNPRNGYTIIRLHYSADKYKDPERVVCDVCGFDRNIHAGMGQCPKCKTGKLKDFGRKWKNKTKRGMTEADWQQEYEINWKVQRGKRVFPPFRVERHVAPCEVPPRSLLYRGWDFGRHHPCVVVCYDNTMVNSFQAFEVFMGYDVNFLNFCDVVIEHCERMFPGMRWMEGVDPQGSYRSAHGGIIDERTKSDTPVDYMKNRYNLDVDWQNIDQGDVQNMLNNLFQQAPKSSGDLEPFLVRQTDHANIYHKPPNMEIRMGTGVLIDGLGGHCIFQKHADGTYSDKMVKNIYSHAADALGYAYVRARQSREEAAEDDRIHEMMIYRQRPMPSTDDFGAPSF